MSKAVSEKVVASAQPGLARPVAERRERVEALKRRREYRKNVQQAAKYEHSQM